MSSYRVVFRREAIENLEELHDYITEASSQIESLEQRLPHEHSGERVKHQSGVGTGCTAAYPTGSPSR
ncbi:MAG: hypothetical protein Q4G21_11290 [Dermabacter sp.]|nr:hypothetical protein [Dermabacter sp.]